MPQLFKITKNGKSSHVYGTVHSSDYSICLMSTEAKTAFEQSSIVVVELMSDDTHAFNEAVKTTSAAWKKQHDIGPDFWDYLKLSQLKKIAELFEEELSPRLGPGISSLPHFFAQNNMRNSSHTRLLELTETVPIALTYSIARKIFQSTEPNAVDFLDKKIEWQARSLQKPIASLDTADDMAERLTGFRFSPQQQVDYTSFQLSHLLALNEEQKMQMASKMKELYLQGRHDYIHQAYAEGPLSKETHQMIFGERDERFVRAMNPYLENGEAFFAFGMGHLAGVLALLATDGYQIEAIQEGKREHPISTLKNTNMGVLKANLLKWIRHFPDIENHPTYRIDKTEDLIPLLELVKDGSISKNLILEFSITDYKTDDLEVLCQLLKHPNISKTIKISPMKNISDNEIVMIAEVLKTNTMIEDLNIEFDWQKELSEQSLQSLLDAVEKNVFTGKLQFRMHYRNEESPTGKKFLPC